MGSTVEDVTAAAHAAAGEDLTGLPDAVLLDRLRDLQQARCLIDAAMVTAAGTAHRQAAASYDGAVSTKAWLRGRLHLAPKEASDLVEAARALPDLPAFADAFTDGRIPLTHVQTAATLAKKVGPDLTPLAEQALIGHADRLTPAELKQVATRIAQHLRPDDEGGPPDDGGRSLHLSQTFDNTWALKGDLTPEAGALLQTALNAATPRPTPDDDRTATQRRHDALADLARLALNTAGLPTVGGEQPHLSVLVHAHDLRTPHPTPADPGADAGADAGAGSSTDTDAGTDPGTSTDTGTGTDADAGAGANVPLTVLLAHIDDDPHPTQPPTEDTSVPDTTHWPFDSDQPLTVADILAATPIPTDMAPDQRQKQHHRHPEPVGPSVPAGSPEPVDETWPDLGPPGSRPPPPGTGQHHRLLLAEHASTQTAPPDHTGPETPRTGLPRTGPPHSGVTEWGNTLPSEAIRRLACDAALNRIVLGPRDVPLNAGRRTRLVTPTMRRVLVARDRGCRFHYCDRPPAWTQAHHLESWADGGPTDLTNLILLCSYHHHRVHEHHWQLAFDGHTVTITRPDGTLLEPP